MCENITRFLVLKPFYQNAVVQALPKLFPNRIVYDDEKDMFAMLFEYNHTGITPFSVDERRPYGA